MNRYDYALGKIQGKTEEREVTPQNEKEESNKKAESTTIPSRSHQVDERHRLIDEGWARAFGNGALTGIGHTGSPGVTGRSGQGSQQPAYGVRLLEELAPQRIRITRPDNVGPHRVNIVWAEGIDEAELDHLREQIEMAIADPTHVIVTNYQVHWEQMDNV